MVTRIREAHQKTCNASRFAVVLGSDQLKVDFCYLKQFVDWHIYLISCALFSPFNRIIVVSLQGANVASNFALQ